MNFDTYIAKRVEDHTYKYNGIEPTPRDKRAKLQYAQVVFAPYVKTIPDTVRNHPKSKGQLGELRRRVRLFVAKSLFHRPNLSTFDELNMAELDSLIDACDCVESMNLLVSIAWQKALEALNKP